MSDETIDKYPEHVKQDKVGPDAQVIGEFIEWLQEQYSICWWHEDSTSFYPSHVSVEQLLASYFKIDLEKIEQEKRAMLEELRQAQ